MGSVPAARRDRFFQSPVRPEHLVDDIDRTGTLIREHLPPEIAVHLAGLDALKFAFVTKPTPDRLERVLRDLPDRDRPETQIIVYIPRLYDVPFAVLALAVAQAKPERQGELMTLAERLISRGSPYGTRPARPPVPAGRDRTVPRCRVRRRHASLMRRMDLPGSRIPARQ